MTTKTPHDDDLRIPPALAAALDQGAARVPRAAHDLAGVHRRARHLRRRRHAVTGVAAAAALVAGGLGVVRLGSGDGSDVVVPPSASGPSAGGSTTVFVPRSVPAGWTLGAIDASPFPDDFTGPTTSQLFATGGPSPLGRGVVVTSGPTERSELGSDAVHTVRGQRAHLTASDGGRPEPDISVTWFEDGVAHDAVSVGMTQVDLLAFLDSLTPNDDPATGYTAPGGTALPELDSVTGRERTATLLGYGGPGDAEISVTAYSPGPATLLARLEGEPHGDDLVIRRPRGDHPEVTTTLPDGWTVSVVVEAGAVDPAVVDTIAESVERSTFGQLIEDGTMGPVTALATVDGASVQVYGTEDRDLTLCVTPESGPGGSVCEAVVDDPAYGFTSAALVVDGRWTIVTVTDGDEPGQVIGHEGPIDPQDPLAGDVLRGERAEAGERIVEVVTVPDGVDSVHAQSPMTDAGSTATSYHRPD